MKIIQLVSDDFEDLELWCPVMRLREEGIQVDLVMILVYLVQASCNIRTTVPQLSGQWFY